MIHKTERSALIAALTLMTILTWVMWVALGMPFFGIDYLHLIENISYLTVVGGFCGGIAMFIYSKPHGWADGFVRAVVCVMAANMLTQLLAQFVTKNQSTGEMWGVAFMVGFCAFPTMSAVARFFENRKASDISDIVKEIKGTKNER
jgi:Na+/melibiose symporter-like transporter